MVKSSKHKSEPDSLTGMFIRHPKGFGFVQLAPCHKAAADVFIPAPKTLGAFDGDEVELVITDNSSPKGPEGRITHILKRNVVRFAAVVTHQSGDGIELFIPGFGKSQRLVTEANQPYQAGDRLLVSIESSPDATPLWARVLEKIGTVELAASDIPFACAEFNIRTQFPRDVLEQIAQLPDSLDPKDYKERLDLTSDVIFTIDPSGYTLGVHIADVAYFVPEGSPLDKEAILRANSTYFPGLCIPMLPHELSSKLCSLQEKEVRLAASLLMRFDPQGQLIHVSPHRSLIRSCRKFSYEEAFEILEGRKKDPLFPHIKALDHLASLMRQARRDRGSVDLAMKETKILVDAEGNPTGVKVIEYDKTHQLVEECMLKANQVVAETLSKHKLDSLYRVHEAPMASSTEEFSLLAQRLGFDISSRPEVGDVQKLFALAKSSPHFEQLSIAFIRSMKLAFYSERNVGHFGLSLSHYSHFTSPIRRYSDLVVHRAFLDRTKPKDLTNIAKQCSDSERRSFRAEMRVVGLKKLRLLRQWKQEGKSLYTAYISRLKPFGVTFEIPEIAFEGTLALAELGNDFYVYMPKEQLFVGKSSREKIAVGAPIEVYLDKIDLIRMEAKFTRVSPQVASHKKRK